MTVSVLFTLEAEAAPGLLPRLLQPFAKRDLVPDHLRACREGDTLHVELGMTAMPAEMVHLVAGNLTQVIGVLSLREARTEAPNGTLRAAA
jgi:hypothetical protein